MFTIHLTAAKWNFLQSFLAHFILFLTKQGGRKASARGKKKKENLSVYLLFNSESEHSLVAGAVIWQWKISFLHLVVCPLELLKLIQNFQEGPGKSQNIVAHFQIYSTGGMCLPHLNIFKGLVNAFGNVSHELYSLVIPQMWGEKAEVHI